MCPTRVRAADGGEDPHLGTLGGGQQQETEQTPPGKKQAADEGSGSGVGDDFPHQPRKQKTMEPGSQSSKEEAVNRVEGQGQKPHTDFSRRGRGGGLAPPLHAFAHPDRKDPRCLQSQNKEKAREHGAKAPPGHAEQEGGQRAGPTEPSYPWSRALGRLSTQGRVFKGWDRTSQSVDSITLHSSSGCHIYRMLRA